MLFHNSGIFNSFNSFSLDILTLIIISFSVYTIISKNPIVSILYLICLFGVISVYLILIGLTFIGLSYLLVYIGAVSILFLFILMMINIRISELVSTNKNYIPLAIISLITLVNILSQKVIENSIDINSIITYNFIKNLKESINFTNSMNWESNLIDITHISAIGNIMYSSYSLWLIIISMILLLAMVGSIVITINR